jgi:hypothetical protein
VYCRYHAVERHPETRQCTKLVVTFADRVVTDLHLVNDRAEVILAARAQSGAPAMVATAR